MRRSVVLISLLFGTGLVFPAVISAQSPGEQLCLLPTTLTDAQMQSLSDLRSGQTPKYRQPIADQSWQEPHRGSVSMKDSVIVFRRQSIWPVKVRTYDGSEYWGEITKIDDGTFELLNRKTKQTTTITYRSVQGIGIVKAYPPAKSASPGERAMQRTGEVIGIILLAPVRILELFLVPQC